MFTQLIFPEDAACAQQCAREWLSQLRIVMVQAMKDETKVVPVSVNKIWDLKTKQNKNLVTG